MHYRSESRDDKVKNNDARASLGCSAWTGTSLYSFISLGDQFQVTAAAEMKDNSGTGPSSPIGGGETAGALDDNILDAEDEKRNLDCMMSEDEDEGTELPAKFVYLQTSCCIECAMV